MSADDHCTLPSPATLRIALIDGTWGERDLPEPSSVCRLDGLLHRHRAADGRRQAIYYRHGVGAAADLVAPSGLISQTMTAIRRIWGGASGAGIGDLVDDVYSALAMQWRCGDELVLVGWSRGAMAATLVAAEVARRGLGCGNAKCQRCRQVRLVAMLDRVSTWGVPEIRLLERHPRLRLGSHVLDAVHYVAIDEDRRWFPPHLMEPVGEIRRRREVWCVGGHGDVGGGWPDRGLADVVLADVIGELAAVGAGLAAGARARLAPNFHGAAHRSPGWWPRTRRRLRRLLDAGPAVLHRSTLQRTGYTPGAQVMVPTQIEGESR